MKKLDINYWVSKFDRLEDSDEQAIADAFRDKHFSKEEKQLLSDIILAGEACFKSEEDALTAFNVTMNFSRYFAVNPMFHTVNSGHCFRMYRYDYRKLLNCIPEYYAKRSIVNIYKRLGVELKEDDIARVGASENIYDLFLSFVKQEAGADKVLDVKTPIPKIAMYLNYYLLYDKLGFEGQDVFHVFAEAKEMVPTYSTFKFVKLQHKEKIEDAIRRSRGRMYVTPYEMDAFVDACGLKK